MKREDLKKIEGLTDEQIDKIMAEAGKDVEAHKGNTSKVQAELDQVKSQLEAANAQLTEAGKQIEAFKGMDIDGIKKAADDWKAQAEKAQADARTQLAALKFDHALDTALLGSKPRNGQTKLVKALLNMDGLKLNEGDGSIVGLKEQIEKIQAENAYLFEGAADDPKIVDKTTTTQTVSNPFLAAVRKGAGLEQK